MSATVHAPRWERCTGCDRLVRWGRGYWRARDGSVECEGERGTHSPVRI